MRYLCLILVLLQPATTWADADVVLRPLDGCAAELLAALLDRSAIVRALAGELQTSDLIVHIEISPYLPAGLGGTTRFAASRGGRRYVRVTISSHLRLMDRMAMLGHELQHVREMAQSSARDTRQLRAWYDKAGHRQRQNVYETTAALHLERLVRAELRAGAPAAASAATR